MSNLSSFFGGGASPKIAEFTSSGTFVRPTNTLWAERVILVGAGGGVIYAGTPTGGGGGGEVVVMDKVYLPSIATITIGSCVNGGAGGNTTMTTGFTGSTGLLSTLTANGGNTTSSGSGGVGGGHTFYFPFNNTGSGFGYPLEVSSNCGLYGKLGFDTFQGGPGGYSGGSGTPSAYGGAGGSGNGTLSGGGGSYGKGANYNSSATEYGGGAGSKSSSGYLNGGPGYALIFYLG